MLIYIDKTIGEAISSKQLDEDQLHIFCEIASAYQRGKCEVFGASDSIIGLTEQIGTPFNSIYKLILARYAECGALVSYTSVVFVVSFDQQPDYDKIPACIYDKALFFSIDNAINIDWGRGAHLLCENLSDCRLYKLIGKYYIAKNHLNAQNISFIDESGGGSSTDAMLKKLVSEDCVPTLCLLDSDYNYAPLPNLDMPEYGKTYNLFSNAVDELEDRGYGNSFYYYVLEAREIENLIPLTVLENLNIRNCEDCIDLLKKLQFIDNGQPILFYDFKKGINIEIDSIATRYWSNIFSQAGISDDKKVFGKISKKLLNVAVEHLENIGNLCELQVENYLTELWHKIGKLIFSWGCTSGPHRS